MTDAEAVDRAWGLVAIGTVVLAVGGVQVLLGKAFIGYGWPGLPAWFVRNKRPVMFWLNVAPFFVVGAFCLGLAAARLL